MRNLFAVLLFAFSASVLCAQTPSKNKNVEVNHGVWLKKIDSATALKIKIVHFKHTEGIVFPAEYADKLLGQNQWYKDDAFFTPDTDLIKSIDKELLNQYCAAIQDLADQNWQNIIAGYERDAKELAKIKKERKKEKAAYAKNCPVWRERLQYFDRQYIAYKKKSGEEVIMIQFLNFREDPYHLKRSFYISWIDGWHGWFETNRQIMHYNVKKRLVTVNDD